MVLCVCFPVRVFTGKKTLNSNVYGRYYENYGYSITIKKTRVEKGANVLGKWGEKAGKSGSREVREVEKSGSPEAVIY